MTTRPLRTFESGLFIVFEGLDFSGKTTICKMFTEYLARQYYSVVQTREPGGTPFAEAVRSIFFKHPELSATTQALLVNAARRDHVEHLIVPAMQKGSIVVSDRWVPTTHVYQRDMASQSDLKTLCEIGSAGLMPDILFIFDITESTFIRRKEARGGSDNHLDDFALNSFNTSKEAYINYWKAAVGKCVLIDANQGMLEVYEQVVAQFKDYTK